MTRFPYSKVMRLIDNHLSKGTFVISSWRRIRMWWNMSFLVLWSQNPSILCWTCFLALFQPQSDAVDHLWTFKGEESSGQPCVQGWICDHLLDNNKNVVEDIVYDTLITKYFYFMLNMVFDSFSNPSRFCWPCLAIQSWGKEWSTIRWRVTLRFSFGAES